MENSVNIAQIYPLPRDIMKPFVDWLSFSLPFESKNFDWIVSVFGKRNDLEKGFLGYSNSFLTELGVRVAFTPEKPQNKIHCVLSGKVLSGLPKTIQIENLIEDIIQKSGTFARIDLAIDDFEGFIDYETIWNKLESKEVGTRFRGYSRIQGQKNKSKDPEDFSRIESGSLYKDTSRPQKSGDTIYIGNRKSEVFCRIYDKIKETKSNQIEVNGKTYFLKHWNRLEFELKGDASDQYCNPHEYINLKTGEIVHKSLGEKTRKFSFMDRSFPKTAFYYLKFLEPTYKLKKLEDGTKIKELKHKRHWETSPWWIDFLKQFEGEKIGLSFIRPGLEGVRDWMVNQNSGAYYLMKDLFGDNFLNTMDQEGFGKFEENKRYQKLITEFKARNPNFDEHSKKIFFNKFIKKEKFEKNKKYQNLIKQKKEAV